MFWQGLVVLVPFVGVCLIGLIAHALGCVFNK